VHLEPLETLVHLELLVVQQHLCYLWLLETLDLLELPEHL
jgi:hypothetical protein